MDAFLNNILRSFAPTPAESPEPTDITPLEPISGTTAPLTSSTAHDVSMAEPNDIPELESISNDSESDDQVNEVHIQVMDDDNDGHWNNESGSSMPTLEPISRTNRRARVDDDDDDDRDRRHPSQRISNPITPNPTARTPPPLDVPPHQAAAPAGNVAEAPAPALNAQPPGAAPGNDPRGPFMSGFSITIDINGRRVVRPLQGGAPGIPMEGANMAFPNFIDLISAFSEQEAEDPERAKQLVDALEEVPVGLVRRLEALSERNPDGDGTGAGDCSCAICWDRLLDGEGGFGADTNTEDAQDDAPATAGPPADAPGTAAVSMEDAPPTDKDAPMVSSFDPSQPKIVTLPCAHIFHASCLIPWFSRPRQTTCPTCRFNIDPERLTARRRRPTPMSMPFAVPAAQAPPMPPSQAPPPMSQAAAPPTAEAQQDMADFRAQIHEALRQRMEAGGAAPPPPTVPESADLTGTGSNPTNTANGTQPDPNPARALPPVNHDHPHGPHNHPHPAFLTIGFDIVIGPGGPFPPPLNPGANPNTNANTAANEPMVEPVMFGRIPMPFGPGPENADDDDNMDDDEGEAGGVGEEPWITSEEEFNQEIAAARQAWSDWADRNPGGWREDEDEQPAVNAGQAPHEHHQHQHQHHHHDHPHHGPWGPGMMVGTGRTMNEALTSLFNNQPLPNAPAAPDQQNVGTQTGNNGGVAPHVPPSPEAQAEGQQQPQQQGQQRPQARNGISPTPFRDFFTAFTLAVLAQSVNEVQNQNQNANNNNGAGAQNGAQPQPQQPQPQQPQTQPQPQTNPMNVPPFNLPSGNPLFDFLNPPTANANANASNANANPAPGVQNPNPGPNPLGPFANFLAGAMPFPHPHPPAGANAGANAPPQQGAGQGQAPGRPFPTFTRITNLSDIFNAPPPGTHQNKTWTLPPAPGPTLRQKVERREREAGLRCYDVSCGLGPSDEEPFMWLSDVCRQLSIRAPKGYDSSEQGSLEHERDELVQGDVQSREAGREQSAVCPHTFHPACLVSAARVALMGKDAVVVDGDVEVACSVCRGVGNVTKGDWDEGVEALE